MMNLNAVIHQLQPLEPGNWRGAAPAVEEYYRHYQLGFADTMPGVSQHIGTYESGPFDIACQVFLHEEALGTVFIVHGYTDHLGLYGTLIAHLLGQKYSVVGFDLPGHGLSTGELATISSFSHYDRALEDCLQVCGGHLPRPWYVVGQSTGAAAVMSLLLRHTRYPFDKSVLLAPLVRPANWAWLRWVHWGVSRVKPRLRRNFKVNSNDPAFLDFVKNRDPLQPRHLKTAWMTAMNNWIRWFLSLPPSTSSVLVIQGEKDETVDWRYNLKIIREKFPLAQIMLLPDAKHHLVAESEAIRQQAFEAIDRYFQDGQ